MHRELGAQLETLGLLLGDELQQIRVPAGTDARIASNIMKTGRTYFSVSVNGPLSALGDCTSTDPRLRLSPFPPGVPLALGPRDKLRLSEGAATIVGDRRSHVGALSLGKYEMDDWRRDALMLRAVGGGVESPDIVGEGHEDVEGEALAGTLPSTSCNGLGPDNESGRVDSRGELIIVGTRSELPT